jgi:hypothetical protein
MSHSRSDSFTMKAGTDDKKKTDGGETGLVLTCALVWDGGGVVHLWDGSGRRAAPGSAAPESGDQRAGVLRWRAAAGVLLPRCPWRFSGEGHSDVRGIGLKLDGWF